MGQSRAPRWIAALVFITLALTAMAWTVPANGGTVPTGPTSGKECPPLTAPPWLSLSRPVAADAIPGLTEFLEAVSRAFGEDRFSRTWFSEETGLLALVVGIVDPTDADMQLLAALSAGDGTIGLPPVIVQDVPIGLAGLLANQSVVDSILAEAKIEFTSTGRPDAGVVEVRVVADQLTDARRLLQDAAEACEIRVLELKDVDRYQAMVGRWDRADP